MQITESFFTDHFNERYNERVVNDKSLTNEYKNLIRRKLSLIKRVRFKKGRFSILLLDLENKKMWCIVENNKLLTIYFNGNKLIPNTIPITDITTLEQYGQ